MFLNIIFGKIKTFLKIINIWCNIWRWLDPSKSKNQLNCDLISCSVKTKLFSKWIFQFNKSIKRTFLKWIFWFNKRIKRTFFSRMSSSANHFLINNKAAIGSVEIKSKFDAEFRRFSIDGSRCATFEAFQELLGEIHLLKGSSGEELTFHIFYVDPKDNDLLPITNTDNYRRALQSARPLLRLVIQRPSPAIKARIGEASRFLYSGWHIGPGNAEWSWKSSRNFYFPASGRWAGWKYWPLSCQWWSFGSKRHWGCWKNVRSGTITNLLVPYDQSRFSSLG